MAMRFEQITGDKIDINAQLCLVGKAKSDNPHKKLANRLASTTLWWICKTYYERKELKSSWEIGRELNMYRHEDRIFMKENWRATGLDVEIDSRALKEKIMSLSERELRAGEGNLAIWLRNQMGNFIEPKLERESGLIGLRQFPKFARGRNDRDIKFSKLLYLISLDEGLPPHPPTP